MKDTDPEKKKTLLKLQDMLEKVQEKAEKSGVGGPKKVGVVVKAVYGSILEALESTETGAVTVQGLGQFKIRNAKVKEGDAKLGLKRISFRSSKPKGKKRK